MKFKWMVLFVVLSLTPSLAYSEPPVRVGAMSELSGPYAVNGEECRRGYELARREVVPANAINGREIEVVFGDTQGDARIGVTEFQRLVDAEHVLGVATTRSAVAMPLNPISKRLGIPLLATVAHPRFVAENPYAFRFWPNASEVGADSARWMVERNVRRVFALTAEDEFMMSLTRTMAETGRPLGLQFVADDTLQGGEINFAPMVARIRAANPDLVFVNLGLPQIGPFLRRLREQGLTTPVLSNTFAAYPEVVRSAGEGNIEGTRYLDFAFDTPAFVQRYRSVFPDREPVAISYSCYLALGTLLSAVASQPGLRDSAELQESLLKLSELRFGGEAVEMRDREAQIPPVRRVFRKGRPEKESTLPNS